MTNQCHRGNQEEEDAGEFSMILCYCNRYFLFLFINTLHQQSTTTTSQGGNIQQATTNAP
jgi:hypothetical protein